MWRFAVKNSFDSQRFLTIYSGVLTVVFAVTILGGFAPSKKPVFEEITVQRVNISEPDGTLRMVISDKALFPGIRGPTPWPGLLALLTSLASQSRAPWPTFHGTFSAATT